MKYRENQTFRAWFVKADQRYSRFVYRISQISPAFLIAIMFLAVADTLTTKLFSCSIKNSYALIQYFSIPTIYLTMATVQMARGHTRMGMFADRMPPLPKLLCSLLSGVLSIAVCALMSWESFRLFLAYLEQGKSSTATGIGGFFIWPFTLCFFLGYGLLTIAFLFSIFRAVFAFSAPSPEAPKPSGGELS